MEGFLEEVEGAEGGGVGLVFGQLGGGHDHDAGLGMEGGHLPEKVEAVAVGELDVGEEDVDAEALGTHDGLGDAPRPEEAGMGQLVHDGALDDEGRDGAVLEEKDDGAFGVQGRRVRMDVTGEKSSADAKAGGEKQTARHR